MNGSTRGFICGFGDVQAGIGGLAWDLGEPGALLLNQGEVRQASFALEHDLETVTVEITAEADTVAATLAPQRTLVDHPSAENPVEFKATASLAEVRPKGGGQTIECTGQVSEWIGDPLEGAGVLRHVAVGVHPGPSWSPSPEGYPEGRGTGASTRAAGCSAATAAPPMTRR